MRIIDVSLPLSNRTPTYPGNQPTVVETVDNPASPNVASVITMGSHSGTHVDAPSHSIRGAKSLDQLDLQAFYGPCRLLDMTACETSVTAADLQKADIKSGERILIKTANSKRGFAEFYDDYVFLAPDGAEYLAGLGVALVGIDTLSIKQRGNPDNTAHTAFMEKDIPIIEGLNLKKAEAGVYTLVAFPLAFQDIDGSPVRAVLIED